MSFMKKDTDAAAGEHFSVVSAECYFQGTLSVQGSLRVDGTLEGTVDNAHHVIVGNDGKIVGDVTAEMVVCGGVIEGNVCADMLEVLGEASIVGDIRAKRMRVEEGGSIDGRCTIGEKTGDPAGKANGKTKNHTEGNEEE